MIFTAWQALPVCDKLQLSLITSLPYSDFTSSGKPSLGNPVRSHLLCVHPWVHPANPTLDLLESCFSPRILGCKDCKFLQTFPLAPGPRFPPPQEWAAGMSAEPRACQACHVMPDTPCLQQEMWVLLWADTGWRADKGPVFPTPCLRPTLGPRPQLPNEEGGVLRGPGTRRRSRGVLHQPGPDRTLPLHLGGSACHRRVPDPACHIPMAPGKGPRNSLGARGVLAATSCRPLLGHVGRLRHRGGREWVDAAGASWKPGLLMPIQPSHSHSGHSVL